MFWRQTVILVLLVFLFGLALTASAQQKMRVKAKLAPAEVEKIAKEAYIFGYPLVLMDVTRHKPICPPSRVPGPYLHRRGESQCRHPVFLCLA